MIVNKKLIEDVKCLKTSLQEISVYDLDVFSSLELYYKIAKKLNEVIKELSRFEGALSDEVIKQNEKLLYLLGEGLNLEVVKKINQMVNDGTMDSIINNEVFGGLNNKIDDFKLKVEKKEIVSIMDYGAIGDKVNDDTTSIKSALKNGRYVTAKGEKHFIVTDLIEIPENTTLDFNNAYVTFKGNNACFKLKKTSSLKNVKIIIPANVVLSKSIIYLDGNDVFHVGWSHTPLVKNISFEQLTDNENELSYRENIGIWLDARQNSRNTQCCVSGAIFEDIKGVRLKHIIYLSSSDQLNNSSFVYINSNTFKNIQGYNCKCFIKDEVLRGSSEKVGNGGNVYDNLHFQPADDKETCYIDIAGDGNSITNALFWDNSRPSNIDNQIIVRGSYNSINGSVLPPYKSSYVNILGDYNFYQGQTYGIPTQYFGGKYISGRGYQKEWRTELLLTPHIYKKLLTQVKSGLIEGSNDTIAIDFPLKFGDIGEGTTHIKLKSFGSCEKTTEIRRFWLSVGQSKYFCGGSSESIFASNFDCDVDLIIRKYKENYADIIAKLKYSLGGDLVLNQVKTERLYNITQDQELNPKLLFGSSSNENMTQVFGEIKIDFHE